MLLLSLSLSAGSGRRTYEAGSQADHVDEVRRRSLLLYLLNGVEGAREREILFILFFYNFRVGVFTSRMETESRVGE